jgi:NADH:ubiquinone oxidoreductase subunit 6 (subunit J)
MSKNDKILRERLLNIDTLDSVSGKILKQSLLELEGRLSIRKRLENAILAVVGGAFAFFFMSKMSDIGCTGDMQDVLLVTMIAGAAFSLLWTLVAGWQAVRGRCNERWYPPLKAAGIVGTLFVSVATLWFALIFPRIMAEGEKGETSNITTLATVIVLGIMMIVCIVTVLAVYWRVCSQGAKMNEKMIETQCMIAELQEKLSEKKL